MTKPKLCPRAPGLLEEYAAQFDDLFTHVAQRRGMRGYLVPLENTMRPGDLRVLGDQAAWVYSLIRPLRTGLRRICCLSTSVTIAQGASRSSAGTRCAMPWWGLAVL